MNSSGATQSSGQGACGQQVEEEDEESSSSSLTESLTIEDELESFRQKWKQDLQGTSSTYKKGEILGNEAFLITLKYFLSGAVILI